jgi:acyl carrier protein
MDPKPIVRDVITRTVLASSDRKVVADDEPLLDASLIDSVGILEVVEELEQACGVRIEDEELIPENFRSIDDITAFVRTKIGTGQS